MNPGGTAVDGSTMSVLGAIVVFVVAGQLFVADPMLRYASGLLGFSFWMAWFVLVAVRWLTVGPYR